MAVINLTPEKIREIVKIVKKRFEKDLITKYFKIQGKPIVDVLLISRGKNLYSQVVVKNSDDSFEFLEPSRGRIDFYILDALKFYFGFEPSRDFLRQFKQKASEVYWGGDDPSGEILTLRKAIKEDQQSKYQEILRKRIESDLKEKNK